MLIVEDDPATYTALRAILSRKGYDVAVATTLSEAEALMEPAPAGIVLDLMLPDGDGASLLRQVRRAKLPIRVLVTTGANDPARLSAVACLLPEALLRKPIDLGELLRLLPPSAPLDPRPTS